MEEIIEIVTNRVFFQVRSDKPTAGIHMDESDGYIYHYHCMDTLYKAVKIRKYFGPMTLSTIQRHCAIVDASLKHTAGRHLYYTNNAETIGYQQKRTNAIFLVGCYLILRKNCSPDETREKLKEVMVSVTPYTDMEGSTAHTLTLLDCWRGLYHGMVVQQWFRKRDAEVDVTLNDGSDDVANWVVPDRLLALEDPKEPRYMGRGAPVRSSVVNYFKQKHVETVVRLNSKDYEFRRSYGQPYDSEEFVCRAIKHYDIFFKDGGIPSDTQLQSFWKIVRTARRPIAVHCHAGRGRTGTMLACSLIRFWGFDATQAIAWIRMCRAACIVGIQQGFVKLVDSRIKEMSEMTALRKNKEKVEIAAVQRKSLAYPPDKVCKLRKEAAESEEKRRARREQEVSSAHLRLRHRTAIKRRSHTKSSKAHQKGVTREKRPNENSVEKVTVLQISDALNDVRRRRQRTISSTKTPETQRRVSLGSHLSKVTQGKCESKKDIDKTKLKNQQEHLSSRESRTAPLDLKILRKMHPLYEKEQMTKYLRTEVSEKFGCYVVKASGVNCSPSPPAKKNVVETIKGKRLEGLRGQIRAQRTVPYELKERVAEAQDEILRAQPTKGQIKTSKSSTPFVKPATKYSSYQPTFEQLTKLLNFEKDSKYPVPSCSKEYKTLANSNARESLQKADSNSWQGHRSAQNRSKNYKNVVGGRIKAERRLAWQEPEANPQCSTKTDVPVLCMTTRNSRRAVHGDFNFVEKQRAALLAFNPAQCNVVYNGGKTRSII